MIMEVYMSPHDVEKFKNYEKVLACQVNDGTRIKMLIDIQSVNVCGTEAYGLYIQRYLPSQGTGPK